MNKKKQVGLVFILLSFLTLTTGCLQDLVSVQEEYQPALSKYDRLAQEKNERLDLTKLQVEPYGKKVGAQLKAPKYEEFAVNSRFHVQGTIEKMDDISLKQVWIEVEKEDETASFSYYAPLNEQGVFTQSIQLFAGEGNYHVTLRLPAVGKEDQYYLLARFQVINVNPEVKRDIAYTPAGLEVGASLSQPTTGITKAKETFHLEGTLKTKKTGQVMVQLEREGEEWKQLLPVKKGRFAGNIPLFYGKGVHHVHVLVPDAKRKNYFNKAIHFLVDNQSKAKKKPVEFFKHYVERGIKLESPVAGGDQAALTYRIQGKIDADAPYADQTKHLIVQTKKEGQEATYFIPVTDYQFDAPFWLRFGEGEYEITINVPEITNQNRDYFRFFGVARFHITSTAQEDLRNTLPSRGIQSKDPQIHTLATELTKGRQGERAKAKAIYDYVAQNVRYDVQKYKNDAFRYDDSALKTLRQKKGVCQDYSFLTIALLRSLDIETRFVEGRAEGERHAWVEVKIGDRWVTMDPTWGAGYINNQDQFIKKFTSKYFDPDLKVFSRTHTRTGVMY